MSFREPAILWFALLLIVPLLLYLLPMPRRRVTVSALYLWQRFLESERFGHTSERFRRALGFALLAAILLSLVLAAADLMAGSTPVNARRVVVLVDVSASMNAIIDGKSNLSRAKDAAARFIGSLDRRTEVVGVEAAEELRVISPLGSGGPAAAKKVQEIEPFDGPCNMRRALADAWRLWGDDPAAQLFAFTDNALAESPWGNRAHAWIAPAVGDQGNAAIVGISARRQRGQEIAVTFTLANYGRARRMLSGAIATKGSLAARRFDEPLEGGQTVQRTARFETASALVVDVSLNSDDPLPADDTACVHVPSLDELRVGVRWPEGNRRNDYVAAVLAALREEGAIGPVVENSDEATPVTVYVNQLPSAWREGGAIVLYPLRSGVIDVAGLHAATVTVARQAEHRLLDGVDLRGLPVKGAVQAAVPQWATPLVWAEDSLSLVWAGQAGKTKVLFVGIPVMPSGSRLPLVASFPVLMRNAFQWMLPQPESLHPGDRIDGWTSRKAGLVKGPDGKEHAFSLASAEESDLRRPAGLKGEILGSRRSLTMFFVVLVVVLLPIEWALFHKRLTE